MMDASGIIHFDGTGNILVQGGIMPDGSGLTTLVTNTLGVEQGTVPSKDASAFHKTVKEACDQGDAVHLLFKDTSSIDVLIHHLTELRNYMEAQDG